MMISQSDKAEQFRELHVPGKPLVVFNIWDAGSAKAVASGGAKAIGTSGWAVADANGFADGERIPLAFAIENLHRIAGVTELPVTVDLESGYGDAPDVVGQTIRLAIDAGAVGCNLEDSFPANGKLRKTTDQAERIRRCRQVIDATKIRFFVNARTDVFFQRPAGEHDEALVEETLERAHAYAEAGADGLFAPGLVDLGLIERLATGVASSSEYHGGRSWSPAADGRRKRGCKSELRRQFLCKRYEEVAGGSASRR